MFETTDPHRQMLWDAVQEYIELGLAIIPISPESKKPMIEWGGYDHKPLTMDDWEAIAAKYEDYNIAVATGHVSGIVILDLDTPEAQQWAVDNGYYSEVSVRTKKGLHLYFAAPEHKTSPKVGGTSKDWPNVRGLDFRGDGGYALIPPSKNYTFQAGHLDLTALTPWRSWTPTKETKSTVADIDLAEFSFASLDLSAINAEGAVDLAKRFMADTGRKMSDGDGRNNLVAKYAGELVAKGVVGESLTKECHIFMDNYFDAPLEERELLATLASVVARDKREHPERWEKLQRAAELAAAGQNVFVFSDDVAELMANVKAKEWLVDPIIAKGEVTHITAYSGHGKSLLTFAICRALAGGKSFGPFTVRAPARVMYVDAENPWHTIGARWRSVNTEERFGADDRRLAVYTATNPKVRVQPLNLSTDESVSILLGLVKEAKPDVIVLDTVRSLFPGLDENKAKDWSRVNMLLQYLKAHGCAVVVLHHRNKPGETGMGSEAGSTAQLALVDTQVILTQVFKTEEEAKVRAGLHNDKVEVYTGSSKVVNPWEYIEQYGTKFATWNSVFRLSYGKTRSLDDNQTPVIIGIGRFADGTMAVANEYSRKQKAMELLSRGYDAAAIASQIHLPHDIVKLWLS